MVVVVAKVLVSASVAVTSVRTALVEVLAVANDTVPLLGSYARA